MAVGGGLPAVKEQNFAFAKFQVIEGVALCRPNAIAQEIVGIVEVLFDVSPRSSVKLSTVDGEQIEPGIFSSEVAIAGHERTQRAQGETVAAEAGGDKQFVGAFSDERQTVAGFYDLSEPSVRNLGGGKEFL